MWHTGSHDMSKRRLLHKYICHMLLTVMQNPCLNKVIHMLFMTWFATFNALIQGHKNFLQLITYSLAFYNKKDHNMLTVKWWQNMWKKSLNSCNKTDQTFFDNALNAWNIKNYVWFLYWMWLLKTPINRIIEIQMYRSRGYKTFFMLNSTEHKISTAHKKLKYQQIKKCLQRLNLSCS